MSRLALRLDPLDVLFFRDGRPFGTATRAQSGLPAPQTLLGAVRSALLERFCPAFAGFRQRRDRPPTWDGVCQAAQAPPWLHRLGIRGPWLARVRADEKLDVLVPAPAVLHRRKKAEANQLYRLQPLRADRLPGWQVSAPDAQKGTRPLWLTTHEATERADGYLSLEGLAAFLRGEVVDPHALVRAEDLFGFDRRTGIRVHADRLAAEESQIYEASFLALRPRYSARELHEPPSRLEEVVLYAEVVTADGAPQDALTDLGPLALGGEGRRVAVRPTDPVCWPEATPSPAQKPLILLTTPTPVRGRWHPSCLEDRILAAAVSNPVAVSGWDLARGGPKPTRFAAPAGSVYFLDRMPDGLPLDSLADDAEDRLSGWGCYVKGAWTDA